MPTGLVCPNAQTKCSLVVAVVAAGFSLIFLLNSMLAWISLTPFAIRQIEKLSYDYIKVDCAEGKCYGVLAVCDCESENEPF